MKIAIATNNSKVSGHFGHCDGFTMVSFNGKEITDKEFIASPQHQPGLLPRFLNSHGVNGVIAGGMGKKAQDMFNHEGIEVFVGIQGSIEHVIKKYQQDGLKSTHVICEEHQHHNEHCDH